MCRDNVPLSLRLTIVQEANLSLNKLPHRSQTLLSINTYACEFDLVTTLDFHRALFHVENDGRNEVTHCKILVLGNYGSILDLLKIEVIRLADLTSSQTTSR